MTAALLESVAPAESPARPRVQIEVFVTRREVGMRVDCRRVPVPPRAIDAYAGPFAEAGALVGDLLAGTAPDAAALLAGDVSFSCEVGSGYTPGWTVLCGRCKAQYGTGNTLLPGDIDLPTLDGARAAAVRHLGRRHELPTGPR